MDNFLESYYKQEKLGGDAHLKRIHKSLTEDNYLFHAVKALDMKLTEEEREFHKTRMNQLF